VARRSEIIIGSNALARRALAAVLIVTLIGLIAFLTIEVRRQLAHLISAASENLQWSLGQAETEFLRLENATLNAQLAARQLQSSVAALASDNRAGTDPTPSVAAAQAAMAEALSELRTRFDIVFSRVNLLATADVLQPLRQRAETNDRVASAQDFTQRWVPIIDGPDTDLIERLPLLQTEAMVERGNIRRLALEGLAYFATIGDARRAELTFVLLRIGVLTILLVVTLLFSVLAVLRLARTSAREAEANRETRKRMEAIISSSLDAVVVVNRSGRIIEFNGAAEQIFGHSRTEAIGRDMARLIIPETLRAAHERGMRRYLLGGEPRVLGQGIVQLEALRKDGSTFPVDISLARGSSPRGEIFISFIRDISGRVGAEEALRQARDRAIAGEKHKAELLAVMSHEMRTPLNGMLGTLDLFDESRLEPQERRWLQVIRQSGEVLLGHVNEVLDISRLDAGKMSLRKTRFNLVELLQEIVDTQADGARARGNTLVLTPPEPELTEVYSDPDRLRQIVLNFVSNAVKFTRDGRITIEADGSAGLDEVEIRVIDTGVGIAPEHIDRIFDDFVTIDSSYGRRNTGTGLGLSISSRLAAVLGGEIGAESEPGDGSVFWLRLPMSPPFNVAGTFERLALAPGEAPDLAPLDVLLVEDNAINREVAHQMLLRAGHRVTEAVDGETGVALALERRFDVIMMDISMPGMDGLTAARLLRDSGTPAANVPIIATTAHALPDEVAAFRAAGMRGVLTKPISAARLLAALAQAVASEAPASPAIRTPEDGGEIDWQHLDELLEDLPAERLRSALVDFGTEVEAFFRTWPEAPTPEVLKAFGAEAHRLAGSAGVFGAVPLTGLFREIQHAAQAADTAQLARLRVTVAAQWRATRSALEAAGYALS
jgi:PAS domain S-box-containing protein